MLYSTFVSFRELLEDGHPLAYLLLLPIAVSLLRLSRFLLSTLAQYILRNQSYSSGLHVPPIVKGSTYPYGIVELKGRRPYMEDRHTVVPYLKNDPKNCLYGVFDGHGG